MRDLYLHFPIDYQNKRLKKIQLPIYHLILFHDVFHETVFNPTGNI